jgi:pimeloyl-ACP methyl ester carboxylesterase
VLHYFDNFPTAAVVTRATRLRGYLARRIARGEISISDDVILVGHSTGGLDIRRLLWDLHHRRQPIVVDGGTKVEPARILKRVRRVVFLSVPQWGTNIADWVHAYGILSGRTLLSRGVGNISGQAEPPDATTGRRSGGAARVSAAPGCWDSHLLRAQECEDMTRSIDSKDATSGPNSDT